MTYPVLQMMVTNMGFLLKIHDTIYECASKINELLRDKHNHGDIFLFLLVYSFISVKTNKAPGQNKTLYYGFRHYMGCKDTRNVDGVLEGCRCWYPAAT